MFLSGSYTNIYRVRTTDCNMQEFTANNITYINIKDIFAERKDYCRGIRSYTQLLERKNIKDTVYGQIVNDELVITEKYSRKFGSIFINKTELTELFHSEPESFPPAPPVIEDKDLVFFKDENNTEYNVLMRGERTREGIYFKVKDVMWVFEMPNLQSNIQLNHTVYQLNLHYKFFTTSGSYNVSSSTTKEMYLTYDGLMHVIEASRSGVAYKFKKWIHEVVFSAAWGTKEQKVATFKKVLNVDADHLKAIMNKSAISISCLYLINIKTKDNNERSVFKYGFTDNVHRRFKEHMKTYGDDIELNMFILIPILDLSKAEAEFKNSVSRYRYHKEGEQELISLCDEAYLNIKTIFRTISEKYCGNMKSQIAQYEYEINELKHSYELQLRDKDIKIATLEHKLDCSLKDNEILQLKLQLAELRLVR